MFNSLKSKAEAEKRTYGHGFNKTGYDASRCAYEVCEHGRTSVFHQCYRKPGFGPEGIFCKIHDPAYLKKKDEDQRAKWKQESDLRHMKWKRDADIKKACEGMEDPVKEVAALKKCAAALAPFAKFYLRLIDGRRGYPKSGELYALDTGCPTEAAITVEDLKAADVASLECEKFK